MWQIFWDTANLYLEKIYLNENLRIEIKDLKNPSHEVWKRITKFKEGIRDL